MTESTYVWTQVNPRVRRLTVSDPLSRGNWAATVLEWHAANTAGDVCSFSNAVHRQAVNTLTR